MNKLVIPTEASARMCFDWAIIELTLNTGMVNVCSVVMYSSGVPLLNAFKIKIIDYQYSCSLNS